MREWWLWVCRTSPCKGGWEIETMNQSGVGTLKEKSVESVAQISTPREITDEQRADVIVLKFSQAIKISFLNIKKFRWHLAVQLWVA